MPRKRITPIRNGPAPEFDYTASFQRFTDSDLFARFCATYPKPEAAVTYVYRLFPVIDRGQAGSKDSSLEKVTGTVVDAEYLGTKWGSGRYHILFNDSSRPENLQQVAKCTVEVEDPLQPPNVNPAELVCEGPGGDKNSAVISKYLNMGWTILDAKNELKPNTFKQLMVPSTNGGNAERVLAETVQSLALNRPDALPANAVVVDRDMLRELMAGRKSGGDELERAFQIAERLRPAEDKTTQVLMAKMADALFARRSENPAPAPVQPDSVSQLRTTMQFLRDEMGWSNSAGNDGGVGLAGLGPWGGVLVDLLKNAASGFGQALAMRMTVPGGQVPESVPVASLAAPAPVLPFPNPAAGGNQMVNPMQLQGLISLGQAAIAAFEAGTPGEDFAEQVCSDPATEPLYDDLVAMGKRGIFQALSMVPGLSEKLAPRRAEYEAWLDSFLVYNEDEPIAA